MVHSSIAAPDRTPATPTTSPVADHRTRLRNVLRAIALESLGREPVGPIHSRNGALAVVLIGGPVESAADAAIERLTSDLALVIDPSEPGRLRLAHEDCRRAELGLD
jgi:hypothetical protein